MLRTLVRDKSVLVAETGDWLRRMQKSLGQMNVRVHRTVSDLDGTTGMAITRALIKMDSRLVVNQFNRRWPVKKPHLAEL